MSLKALFVASALSLLTSVAIAEEKKAADAKPAEAAAAPAAKADAKPAEEKVELKADADPEVKAAIEAADAANAAAKKAGFEWYMDGKTMSQHLEGAIKAANEGDKEKALKIAKKVEQSGKAGQDQAEVAKKAAPRI